MLTCISDLIEVALEYEQEVFKRILEVIKPRSLFVDIGAHIGKYSFPVAKLLSENGLIIAIKPDPRSFKALTKGIELNNLRNIIALNAALGDKDGEASLCLKNITAASSIIEYDERCERIVKVSMRSLDSLITELRLSRIDIIKIDAEGSELLILRGAVHAIERLKPHIFVKVRHQNYREFEKIMNSLDYRCEVLVETAVDRVFQCYASS